MFITSLRKYLNKFGGKLNRAYLWYMKANKHTPAQIEEIKLKASFHHGKMIRAKLVGKSNIALWEENKMNQFLNLLK